MTRKQTGDLKQNYGLGWWIEDEKNGVISHGGSAGTYMTVDRQHGLAFIFMAGMYGGTDQPRKAFEEAALARYSTRQAIPQSR